MTFLFCGHIRHQLWMCCVMWISLKWIFIITDQTNSPTFCSSSYVLQNVECWPLSIRSNSRPKANEITAHWRVMARIRLESSPNRVCFKLCQQVRYLMLSFNWNCDVNWLWMQGKWLQSVSMAYLLFTIFYNTSTCSFRTGCTDFT